MGTSGGFVSRYPFFFNEKLQNRQVYLTDLHTAPPLALDRWRRAHRKPGFGEHMAAATAKEGLACSAACL